MEGTSGKERSDANGSENQHKRKGASTRWRPPERGVLGVLSFLGFFTNYMLRVNINIAIVEMVSSPAPPPVGDGAAGGGGGSCTPPLLAEDNHTAPGESGNVGEFDWSAHQQGLVLGSYYWCYVLTLLPANLLAQRLGTKLVFGSANLLSSLGALLTPVATRHHYATLIVVRVLQGLSSGPTWPAMHVMVSKWIPPHERSKFVSTYYGNSVGAATAFPLCGVLIAKLGWEYAFYVPGLLGITWCFLWWTLVFDSPAEHPRITSKEREMIEREVQPYLARKQPPVPMKDILTSAPFWALIVGNVAGTWCFLFFLTYGPTYFKNVHGLGVEMNGLVSGLPNLSRFAVAATFSWLADHLLKTRGWSVTAVRKLATANGHGYPYCTSQPREEHLTTPHQALVLPAALCLVLTHTGCSSAIEATVFVVMTGLGGCASSGTLANSLDLAPNFAGVTLGLVSFVSVSSGFLIPPLVSFVIKDQPYSLVQWRLMFGLAAGMSLVSCLVFMCFGSGEVQRWNNPCRSKPPPAEMLLMDERQRPS